MKEKDREKIIRAGKISIEAKKYARSIIKKGVPLVEIADKIEDKITEFGGRPAFPCNLSIDHIAAHYTPSHDDKTLAHGLLKIDLGVSVDGWCADTAFSIDLENNEQNQELIKATEAAVQSGIDAISSKKYFNEVGAEIDKTISGKGFNTIINLTGHSIGQYDLHAGETIPNIDDRRKIAITPGQYAIEPFATTGNGKIYDGPDSGIYQLINERNVRNPIARKILQYIIEEYSTLPFCSRWIVKKFGTKALFALKQLQTNGNLHAFAQLIEVSKGIVAQTEHNVILEENQITNYTA